MNKKQEAVKQTISQYFLQHKASLAVAESVTAGHLQWSVSSMEEASRFFQGGITAYNIAQKYKYLKVEPIHALAVNCVSQQVANEMALNVCEMFGSNWGIGVTGYASPVPESGNKVFAYFAIAKNGQLVAKGRLQSKATTAEEVQKDFSDAILQRLLSVIETINK